MHVHDSHSEDVDTAGDEIGTPEDRGPAGRSPTTPFEPDGGSFVATRGRRDRGWTTGLGRRPARRLPREEHTRHSWRIHEIAHDFTVEDVWVLRTPGGPGDLPELVSQVVTTDFPDDAPAVVRLLWAARWRLGALLGWDRPDAGLSRRAPSLRQRLPEDLRDLPPGLGFDERFTTLYQLEDEWAAEMANRTVHTVMHLGWVPDGNGGHRGQMAVLVKPNGSLGRAYMTAIKPIRHAWVYPALLSGVERRWRSTHPAWPRRHPPACNARPEEDACPPTRPPTAPASSTPTSVTARRCCWCTPGR